MKKTFTTLGVLSAVIYCTLAYAATGRDISMVSDPSAVQTVSDDETNPNVGVSIGTIEAHPYYESGLNLSYFGNAEYVAQTTEGTYLGFTVESDKWSYDPETGNETVDESKNAIFVALMSTEESVTIPDSIKVGEEIIPVTRIESDWNLYKGFTENIKNLTVPATIERIGIYYDFDQYLNTMYMLGATPQMTEGNANVRTIYVCNKENFSGYLNNEYYTNASILPYGWDFDWITVNVEKKGEFAETYLTQNDYDWGAAQYVKVTGNINDIDLSAIKNLTTLMKLDLSETSITELPENFMRYRTSLVEVKLPSTLTKIGNSAFYGCKGLKSFDLNGITEIGDQVFYECSSLSYINLNGVQTIGAEAFNGCSKLNNIDLSTVVSVGSQSFADCSSIEEINLTSVVTIGSRDDYDYGAFSNCTSLKTITLGNNVQHIYNGAFSNTAIENISIPEGITDIKTGVFQKCSNLSNVEIPASVTSIGYNAFEACTNLSKVSLKTGLVSIESSAFKGCTSLEEIIIPATVNSIGSGAFDNTGIKTFKCYAVVPPTAESSFIGDNMDMTRTFLYVPPFSKDFYRNTQYWSNFNLMRSIEDQIDYILVDRPLTINLEEEDNAVVANNPEINLTQTTNYDSYGYQKSMTVGQLTATGEGTLSAGQLTISGQLSGRSRNSYQYIPTLINYADKMRADNVTHNLTFYNYYGSGEWHFISLPYDVKVSDIVPSDNTYWVIRRYDSAARAAGETSSTWVNLTNDDTLEAGKGYIVSAYNEGYNNYGYAINPTTSSNPTLSFTSGNSLTKNNLFRPTDIIVPLTEYAAEFAHNRSWNLIGNPYPCYFDMHYLNEEFTAPITIWNGNSYVAYSPVDDNLVLSPYEAFFVQCPLDATEMTFKEAGRMHSNEGKPLYKAPSTSQNTVSAEDRNVFNFILSGENYEDRTRIVLNPDAKAEYEIGRDASKFFAGNNDNAEIYVNSDVAYSIDERPINDGCATLGLRSAKEAAYTLALDGKYSNEWHVILTDNETGISVDLTEETYRFTSSTTENKSRFSIRFTLDANIQTGIDTLEAEFGNNAEVIVTNLNGIVVYEGSLSGIQVPESGLYLISNGSKTRKAILN